MSNFDDVKTFMQTFGQEVKIRAEFPKKKIAKLRYDLDRKSTRLNSSHALISYAVFCLKKKKKKKESIENIKE